jgi:hypothetical protein
MSTISELKTFFGEWITAVAKAVDVAFGRYKRRSQILLSESGDQTFTAKLKSVQKGPISAKFHSALRKAGLFRRYRLPGR